MRKAIIAAVSAIFLTGCSSGNISSRKYIRAVSVEKGKTSIAFYGEEADKFTSSDSPDSVCMAAEIGLGKSIFTGHTELIVLGDCDYRENLEYLLTEWKVSPSCIVAYGRDNASYILRESDPEQLAESIRYAAEQGKVPESGIVDVLSGLMSEERSAEIPIIDEYGFAGKFKITEK